MEWLGALEPERWLAVVAGARVFVNASRFEDWGLAQMEALSAGVPLVTVPTPGANAALPLARELAPELVAGERSTAGAGRRAARRAGAGRRGPRERTPRRPSGCSSPTARTELRRRVAEEVLPRLLSSSS